MDGNYIKLNRGILEWEWYHNINTCRLFLHMLLKANWKDGKFEGKTIPRGSFVSSITKLSLETDLTPREVRTALEHLKTTGELTVKSYNKYSVFTVNNYCSYQINDTQNDSQVTGERHPNDNQTTGKRHPNDILTTTIEEKKEGKKGKREEGKKKEGTGVPKKKDPPVYYPDDAELNKAFADYVEMRKKMKKPMTDRAVELAMSKLHKLAESPLLGGMDRELAVKILNQSVMNSWLGLFELKEESKAENTNDGIDWSRV